MVNASNTPVTTMLVELDSILDTRLGVLLDIAPDKVPPLLADATMVASGTCSQGWIF